MTPDAVQPTTTGYGFYLAQFTAGLTALGYGTFYGSSNEHVDGGTSRFDPRGVAYQAVCACFSYTGFPIPPGANTYSATSGSVYTGNNSINYGCNNAAFVLNFQPDVAQAGPDQDVCVAAGPLPLAGSPAGGTWSGPGVSGSAAAGFVFTPTPALLGTQVLTYTVAGTCATTATRRETVTPTPTLGLTPLPVVCPTNAIPQLLAATPTGGTWSGPGVSGAVATGFYFDAKASGTGTFQLTYALPAAQCGTQATLPVTVAAVVAAQVGADTVICAGSFQPIRLRGTPAGGSWAGYGVSGSVATGFFLTMPPGFIPSAGFYFDLVYNVATAGGCSSRAIRRYSVAVPPVPTAAWAVVACPTARQVPLAVHFTLSAASSQGPTYPTPAYTLLWDFGDGTQSTEANPTHIYLAAGHYQPTARLRYNNGLCETTVSLPPLEPTNDPLPNIITPNGDALNQTFRLPSDCTPRLQVFSRWGQQVLDATAYHNDWAAEGQPAGLYYYLLEYPDGHRIKGWLEVIK